MNTEINLMVAKEKPRPTYSRPLLATGIIFVVVFAFGLFVTLYSFALKAQEKILADNIIKTKSKISNNEEIKQKMQITSERVSTAKGIVSNRNNLEEGAYKILQSMPGNLSVNSVSATENLVSLVLESPSLSAFDELMEVKFPALTRNQTFIKKIESTSFQKSNTYNLSVSFTLGK